MNKKIKFMYLLLMISLLPTIAALIFSTIISINTMTEELENGIFNKLNVAAESLSNYYEYDLKEYGDVEYEEGYIDSLLSQNIELTVFKENIRYMTSIYKEGTYTRNIGTVADSDIYNSVKSGNNVQKSGVTIGGEKYYVAYRPIYDGNNNFWGMAFAGTPETEVNKAVTTTRNSLIGTAIFLIVIAGVIGILITLKVKKPMVDAVEYLKVLSSGDTKVDIKSKSPIAEIDAIIDATKSLSYQLNKSIGAVKDSADKLTVAVVDVDKKTSNNVDSVSQISSAIDEVSTTSQTVSMSAINLAEKTSDMGKNIDTLMANVDNLSASSTTIKNANDEATKYMESVLKSSSESVSAVENITNDINRTNSAVKEIESVVGMIEEIASQTKLLSLNASIEAARAGEAGRGFSVVATNIKDLAESSSDNVNKISEIIDRIIDIAAKTAKNAEDVKNIINKEQSYIYDTQNKFEILSESVDSSISQIKNIVEKANGLNKIKKELTDETESLSAISEELGASAQEVSASCSTVLSGCEDTMGKTQEMRAINDILVDSVSFFK